MIAVTDASITLVAGSEPTTEVAVEAGTSPISPGPFSPAPLASIAIQPPTPEALAAPTKVKKKRKARANDTVISSQSDLQGGGPHPPQNTPIGAAHLTPADIDEMRMLSSLLEDDGSAGSQVLKIKLYFSSLSF